MCVCANVVMIYIMCHQKASTALHITHERDYLNLPTRCGVLCTGVLLNSLEVIKNDGELCSGWVPIARVQAAGSSDG